MPGSVDTDGVIEVERVVSRGGTVQLGGRVVLAAEILGGRLGFQAQVAPARWWCGARRYVAFPAGIGFGRVRSSSRDGTA